jgi:hypothetical protein
MEKVAVAATPVRSEVRNLGNVKAAVYWDKKPV